MKKQSPYCFKQYNIVGRHIYRYTCKNLRAVSKSHWSQRIIKIPNILSNFIFESIILDLLNSSFLSFIETLENSGLATFCFQIGNKKKYFLLIVSEFGRNFAIFEPIYLLYRYYIYILDFGHK